MEDRYRDRSSSDDGIDPLFFAQLALDKLFKEEPRIRRRREGLQTKVCHSVHRRLSKDGEVPGSSG